MFVRFLSYVCAKSMLVFFLLHLLINQYGLSTDSKQRTTHLRIKCKLNVGKRENGESLNKILSPFINGKPVPKEGLHYEGKNVPTVKDISRESKLLYNATGLCIIGNLISTNRSYYEFVRFASARHIFGQLGDVRQHLAGALAGSLAWDSHVSLEQIGMRIFLSDQSPLPDFLHGAVWQLFLLIQPKSHDLFWSFATEICGRKLKLSPSFHIECYHSVGHGSFLLIHADKLVMRGATKCPQLFQMHALKHSASHFISADDLCNHAPYDALAEGCLAGMFMSVAWYTRIPSPWTSTCDGSSLVTLCLATIRQYAFDPHLDFYGADNLTHCDESPKKLFLPCIAAMSMRYFRLYYILQTKPAPFAMLNPMCYDERAIIVTDMMLSLWTTRRNQTPSVVDWCQRMSRANSMHHPHVHVMYSCIAGALAPEDVLLGELDTDETFCLNQMNADHLFTKACIRILRSVHRSKPRQMELFSGYSTRGFVFEQFLHDELAWDTIT